MPAHGIEHAESGVGAAVFACLSFRQSQGAEQDRSVAVQGDDSDRTVADHRRVHQSPLESSGAGPELFEHDNYQNQAEKEGNEITWLSIN